MTRSAAEPSEPSTALDLPESEKGKAAVGVGRETLALLQLAAPAVLQLCTMQALVVTNQVVVGHLGATPLAAAALGITVSTPCPLTPAYPGCIATL